MSWRTSFGCLATVAAAGVAACTSSANSSVAGAAGSAGPSAAAGLENAAGSPAFGGSGTGATAGSANAGSASAMGGAGGSAGAASGSAGTSAQVVVRPLETAEAFANPLTGFRPDLGNSNRYATLFRQYIKWNEIENSESDGVAKIKAFSDAAWKNLPALNGKVIPRVYLDWPGQGSYWLRSCKPG